MTFNEWWMRSRFMNWEAYEYAEEAWNAARAQEREACAKLCEEQKDAWAPGSFDHACSVCATEIRKRGEAGRTP